MANENFQPLDSLGPMTPNKEVEESNPARRDYREGRKLLDEGKYSEAAIAFHNALRGFEEQGDEQGVANAVDRLGDACMGREEYAMAIANYGRAVVICKKMDDSFSLLALNKKLAVAHRKLGDFDKTLDLLDDILEHHRLMQNPGGAVEALVAMAEVFREKGDRDSAADAYRAAAEIHARFKHERHAQRLRGMAEALEQE